MLVITLWLKKKRPVYTITGYIGVEINGYNIILRISSRNGNIYKNNNLRKQKCTIQFHKSRGYSIIPIYAILYYWDSS